jgi:hypothetical protein
MRSSLLILCGLLGVVGCKSMPEVTQAGPVSPLVSLERTACFGQCPIYVVSVATDGAVTFVGERFVRVTGTAKGQLSREVLAKLTARLEGSAFLSWKAAYTNQLVTDQPSANLTYKGRTIRHYQGDETAPKELTQLEDDVDALIGTSQWVAQGLTQ